MYDKFMGHIIPDDASMPKNFGVLISNSFLIIGFFCYFLLIFAFLTRWQRYGKLEEIIHAFLTTALVEDKQ
jgi:hypothetical protein